MRCDLYIDISRDITAAQNAPRPPDPPFLASTSSPSLWIGQPRKYDRLFMALLSCPLPHIYLQSTSALPTFFPSSCTSSQLLPRKHLPILAHSAHSLANANPPLLDNLVLDLLHHTRLPPHAVLFPTRLLIVRIHLGNVFLHYRLHIPWVSTRRARALTAVVRKAARAQEVVKIGHDLRDWRCGQVLDPTHQSTMGVSFSAVGPL